MSWTAVIVQARMASTRLHGKVLRRLAGRTVLEHVLTRCTAIENADVICCAIPDGPDCDIVAEEAVRAGAVVSRGSENDVLDRYLQAALQFEAATVMRVSSDCPLIDPSVCAAVIELRRTEQADYASNNLRPDWPHGLDCEAFPVAWLERAAREAKTSFEREHVTPFIRHHAEARKAHLPGPGGTAARQRWTLDTAADLEFLRLVFEELPCGAGAWDYRTVLKIVESNPRLSAINAADNLRIAR